MASQLSTRHWLKIVDLPRISIDDPIATNFDIRVDHIL